ncbi:MAG: OB-fold domain-containing protein [Betaproteobacteria bacterium]|nr:OB-fold domain-containing protein [Betaproteobacteria bacterium]
MSDERKSYLPAGLPIPVPESDGLSAPFWDGLKQEIVRVQICGQCNTWQWGPEWLCHRCHSLDMRWQEVEPKGVVYTIERVWHPVHPALKEAGPYLLVLVELPAAGNLRMLGNLVGDPMRQVPVGTPVKGVFEHHESDDRSWTLLQWAIE